MKVNCIDKNGNNVTKDIDFNFENISITHMKNIFKGCTYLSSIPKMDFTNTTKEEINEKWKNCNNNDY